MSDHFDTEDSRTDICDLSIFRSPSGGDRSVMILDINPDASALEVSFDPAASYELKIDTDGDLEADVAFHVLFAASPDGQGTATVHRATGAAARGTGAIGETVITDAHVWMDGSSEPVASNGYRFFAGLRSDPHFKDIKGFQNNFRWTGDDPVSRRNVFGTVLEVPNAALGRSPIRLWARTMTVVGDKLTQVDTAGGPGSTKPSTDAKLICSRTTRRLPRINVRCSATSSSPSSSRWVIPTRRPTSSRSGSSPTCSSTTLLNRPAIRMAGG